MLIVRVDGRRRFQPRTLGGCLLLTLLAIGGSAAAQGAPDRSQRDQVFVGGEVEEYLRYLQLDGSAAPYPWTLRGFSGEDIARIAPPDSSAHPWKSRMLLKPDTASGLRFAAIAPRVSAIYNSEFPHGYNDGAVWAGRGMTTVVEAGFSARLGRLSLVVAPTLFRAENDDFVLQPNGRQGRTAYGVAEGPIWLDAPQRFGPSAYQRIDPGQSSLRVDLSPLAIGISTANQAWGPASEHPIILGNNAPGFVHAYVGTSGPTNIWIGKVHTRLVWGRLAQSEYSDVTGGASRRFMSGLVGVFTPRGIPGLELGAARFFHTPWPVGGLTVNHFAKPVEILLKAYLPERDLPSGTTIPEERKSDADNQLASVFARWVLPRSGFEIYGEFGREDHNYNLRDVAVQIDHHSAFMLGFRKMWKGSSDAFTGLRAEVLDAQPTHLLLVREQYPFYLHAGARQGHTERGQFLGSYAAYGGAGSIVALDRFSSAGRTSLEWRRVQQREQWPHLEWLPQRAWRETDAADPDAVDVVHAVGIQGLRFVGPMALHGGLEGVFNLNRFFQEDAFNLNLRLGLTLGLR